MSEAEKPSLPDAVIRAGLASIPVVGGALVEFWSYARELDETRVAQMGQAARDAVNDDELFVRRLRENEQLLDMLVEAAEAARRSSWEVKRITMGRVVGQAMKDDSDIDHYAALLSALMTLEAVHFRFLARIEVDVPMPPLSGHPIPEPYKSLLIAQGVVKTGTGNMFQGAGGAEIVSISDFGAELLRLVRKPESPA